MEITPSNTGQIDKALSRSSAADAPLTSIEALNLVRSRTYHATVLGQNLATPNDNKTEKLPAAMANPQQPSGKQATANSSAPAPQEWLLRINDKTLLISTVIQLSKGQTLEVRLAPRTPSAPDPALVMTPAVNTDKTPAQSFISQNIATLLKAMSQSLPRQMSLSSGLSILTQLEQQSMTSQPSNTSLPPTVTKALTTTTLELLRPLWLNKSDLSAFASEQTRQANTNSVPKDSTPSPALQSAGLPPNPPQQNTAAKAELIRTALENSGILLENKLLSLPTQKSFVALQHSLIKAIALLGASSSISNTPNVDKTLSMQTAATSSNASLTPSQSKPTSNEAPPAISHSPARATAPDNAILETKNRLLENYQQLAKARASSELALLSSLKALHAMANPESFKQDAPVYEALKTLQSQTLNLAEQLAPNAAKGSALTPGSDLKSTLTGLLAAMETPGSQRNKPSTFVDGASQPNLLTSPFAFPHPAANLSLLNATQKTGAMLQDQELTTGQMLKLLAGMLNRIQFNQINSLYQSQSNSADIAQTQSWFFELPVANGSHQPDFFNLRLDRDRREQEDKQSNSGESKAQWQISLSFTLETLGELTIQAKLTPPTISTSIWCHSEAILKLIKKEQAVLCKRLEEIGLEVEKFQCLKGQPPAKNVRIDRRFVDTRA